jgi:putative transposase
MSFHFVLDMMDRVTDHGIHLRPLRSTKDGIEFQRLDANDITITLPHEEIAEKFKSQHWQHERHYFSQVNDKLRARGLDLMMSLCTPRERFEGSVRAFFCDVYLEFYVDGRMKKTDASYTAHRDEIQGRVLTYCEEYFAKNTRQNSGLIEPWIYKVPKARRARDIVNAYLECGKRASALIPRWRKCGNRSLRLAIEARLLLNRAAMEFATLRKPSVAHVLRHSHRLFREQNALRKAEGLRPLRVPGRKAVANAIKRIDPFAAYARRFGLDAANNYFSLSDDGVRADFPMQRIEIDEWKIEASTFFETTAVVDMLDEDLRKKIPKGRRWLTLALDCATRCVVGIKISAEPEAGSVVQVIEQLTRDKTDIAEAFGCACGWPMGGKPHEIVHDNGSALISPDVRRVTNDLRVENSTTPAGVARLRGRGERIFRTFGTELMPLLTARTFGSIAEKGDFDPGKHTALSDDELTQILVLFIVDVYHNRPHQGLQGETPANCWKRLSELKTPVPVDQPTRRAIFGLEVNCKLGNRGVRFACLDYVCDELRKFVKHNWDREFRVRVDPLDIGYVSIKVGDRWYPAQCVKRGFDGVAWQDWQAQLRAFRTKFRSEALLVQVIVDDALLKISTIDRNANIRQGLTAHDVTQAQIAWEEQKTNLGVSVEFDPVVDDPDGLFGELIGPDGNDPETIEPSDETGQDVQSSAYDGLPGTSWSIGDE